MPGPLPSGNARRRNKSKEFDYLPQDNTGAIPPWPGEAPMTAAEKRRWKLLWSSPVSRKWEAREAPLVLRVVRLQLLVESKDYSRASELRALEDRLALNPVARQRQRLKVDDTPLATDADEDAADVIPLHG